MEKIVTFFVLFIIAGGLSGTPVRAQSLETGTWHARLSPPDTDGMDVFFHVEGTGNDLQMTLEIPRFRTFPVYIDRVRGGRISFRWRPDVWLNCTVNKQDDGSYQGACFDPRGGRGPILMIPPSVNPEAVSINPEVFNAEWEPPPPPKSQEELIEASVKPQGKKVDVGGYQLNIVTRGEGTVTVVLEAGLGDDLGVWREVQAGASAFARVVAYDRAGLGDSDPAPGARTPTQIASELHTLLAKAGIPPPYVLVGQAEGGLYVRRFAALYPDEVAGLVLVNATHEKQGARLKALSPAAWADYLSKKKAFYAIMPAPLKAEYDGFVRVMEDAALPGAEALPDVPVVVLTGLRPFDNAMWVGETTEGQKVLQGLQKEWVNQGRNVTQVLAEEGGSYLHMEQPALVIEAVRKVVEAVKDGE